MMVKTKAQQGIIKVIKPSDSGKHSLDGLFSVLAGPVGNGLPGRRFSWFLKEGRHLEEVAPGLRVCQEMTRVKEEGVGKE